MQGSGAHHCLSLLVLQDTVRAVHTTAYDFVCTYYQGCHDICCWLLLYQGSLDVGMAYQFTVPTVHQECQAQLV